MSRCSWRGPQLDAAQAVLRFEPSDEPGLADVLDRRVEQAVVHAADEVPVLARELVERAVPQRDRAVVADAGLEAVVFEHVKDDAAAAPSRSSVLAVQPARTSSARRRPSVRATSSRALAMSRCSVRALSAACANRCPASS